MPQWHDGQSYLSLLSPEGLLIQTVLFVDIVLVCIANTSGTGLFSEEYWYPLHSVFTFIQSSNSKRFAEIIRG